MGSDSTELPGNVDKSSGSTRDQIVEKGPSRRTFIAAAGSTGALGLAGCVGGLGAGSDTVKVGFALAQSGVYSLLGKTTIQGFKLHVDEELDGTLGGMDVEYVTQDTAGEPAKGASIAKEYIQREGVDVLVGTISGAVASAIYGVVKDNPGELVWLNPTGVNLDLITENCTEYQFITTDAYYHPTAPMADYAIENLGESAVLTFADYSAGQQYTGVFRDRFEGQGGEIVDEIVVPLGTEDFNPYLQNIDTSADLIFSFFAGADAINYIKQLHGSGIDQEMEQCGTGFLLSTDVLPAQGDAAVGKYSALHYTPTKDIPRNNEFVSAFQNSYDRAPNVYACTGYDSAQIADKAISEVGGTDADELVSTIEGIQIDSPRGYFEMGGPGQHHPIQDVDIREVVAGQGGAPPHNEVVETFEKVQAPYSCQ